MSPWPFPGAGIWQPWCVPLPAPAERRGSTCNWTPGWAARAPSPRHGRSCAGWARAAEAEGLLDVVGVMSHLGCADTPFDPCTDRALDLFRAALSTAAEAGLRPRRRHLAATSATLTDPRTRFDLARVGAGLYGIDPTGTTRLHPALTLTAPVVSVRAVPAGAPAGYGHAWTAARRTHLALLPVGYADGLPAPRPTGPKSSSAAAGAAW